MKVVLFLIPALIFGCATFETPGPLPVLCSDSDGVLYRGEAEELLHLIPEGYWEFFDTEAGALVRVHGNCHFIDTRENQK